MLHITNGESAASVLRAAGLPGPVLAWNDVLHDGPVPGDVSFNQLRAARARFIADCGWNSFENALREFTERDRALDSSLTHDEVVLWFEHDLYDQLQLLQLLDWFAVCELGATKLSLICDAEYLGPSTPARLLERFPARRPVTDDQLSLARRAWAAFRSSDPRAIETLLHDDTSALPYVRDALRRHLEQFPSVTNGLSRTQAQALDAVAGGFVKLGKLYVESQQRREAAVFLGDTTFALHLAALSRVPEPLVLTANGDKLSAASSRAFWDTEIQLTPAGRAVLTAEADHVRLNGIDRWFGGVHLEGSDSQWRWDDGARRLRSAPQTGTAQP